MKKRILGVLLALCMCVCAAIPVLAASQYSGLQYKEMTIIGDSVASGYMMVLPDDFDVDSAAYAYDMDGTKMVVAATRGTRIDGSYPDQVAKAVGVETYHAWTREALSSIEFRRLLQPDYLPRTTEQEKSDQLISFYANDHYYPDSAEGAAVWTTTAHDQVMEDIANSDLIIVNIGGNDLFAYTLSRTTAAMAGTNTTNFGAVRREALTKLNEQITALLADGNLAEAYAQFFATIQKLNIVEATVTVMAKCIAEGVQYFNSNWGPIMDTIHEAAKPDAKIVAVGLFNGLSGLKLTDSAYSIDLGNVILGAAVNAMNAKIQSYNKTHNYYTIVDITVVPRPAWKTALELDLNNLTWDLMVCTHPSNEGHDFIAGKVLDALAAQPDVKKNPKTGKWTYYVGDTPDYTFTGIASNKYGTWYIQKGLVNFFKTGIVKVNGTTYKVVAGRVIR